MKTTLLSFTLIVFISAKGQTCFQKLYGGKDIDKGCCGVQTSDKGYLIVGLKYATEFGDADVYAVRTDSLGKTLWTYTVETGTSEYLRDAIELKKGGFLLAGSYYVSDEGEYGYMIWLDNKGKEVLVNSYKNCGVLESVIENDDGSLVAVGHTSNTDEKLADVFMLKTDAEGNELWSLTFGGDKVDQGNGIDHTSDGGYIVTGFTYSGEKKNWDDVFLLKTDKNGKQIFWKTFGGTSGESAECVKQTADGGFIIAGQTSAAAPANVTGYIIRTDALGNLLWEKKDSIMPNQLVADFEDLCLTSDGGFILCGGFSIKDADALKMKANHICYIVKYNAEGKRLWSRTFGAKGDNRASSICETADKGFMIVGNNSGVPEKKTDIWFIKTNSEGVIKK